MKLRLRSLESRQTLRIEVPNPCSLSQLRQVLLSHCDFSSFHSNISPSAIHISLNRKDELQSSSPDDSLQSLGITSGDLIFYTLEPTAFSSPDILVSDLGFHGNVDGSSSSSQGAVIQAKDRSVKEFGSDKAGVSNELGNPVGNSKSFDEVGSDGRSIDHEMSSVDNMNADADGSAVLENKLSEPNFLRRVLSEEMGDGVKNHKLLVISVHAVFVEAGFVGFDSLSGTKVDRFYLPDQWPSTNFTMWYTVPELLGNEMKVVESVNLRFQSLGRFVNVYGALSKGGSGTYRVCLDENRFSPAIDAMWARCQNANDGMNQYHEQQVFEFWKIVKDGLALPLLIDLCEKGGLSPPPCLMLLPTELKVKILEYLPGVDIAKVACVCSEFRFLSSTSDLWKKKFAEEFGSGSGGSRETMNWKEKFALSWETKKRMPSAIVPWQELGLVSGPIRRPHRFPRIIRDPEPHRFPQVIGGDYDRFPGLGTRLPFGFGRRGPSGGFFRNPIRRSFSPSCNLGGFNA